MLFTILRRELHLHWGMYSSSFAPIILSQFALLSFFGQEAANGSDNYLFIVNGLSGVECMDAQMQ